MTKQLKSSSFDINLILNKIKVSEGDYGAELGCGQFGHFVFPLARLIGKSGKIYAVDIIKSHLEGIDRQKRLDNLSQIETVWADLDNWQANKLNAGHLDFVLIANTINQLEKRGEALREAIRLLKRGGKLLIIEWKGSEAPFGPPSKKRVDKESFKSAAPKIGLKLTEEFEAGAFHYALLFQKV